ncbi:phosphate ABC transporter substrate-binding protein PstS [Phyllobacterium ifriqiyense]|uniref:phosphate ABC transporter substrate-binding protein PstS n=1 Tax=Phyllobacterium ifriqiyense TaxID=314238 RepID=UPI003393B1A6
MERLLLRICQTRPAAFDLVGSALLVLSLLSGSPVMAEPIRGAGSTFSAPIIAKWAENYSVSRTDGGDFTSPDWTVDYELVGSLAGIMRLGQPEMDFAATEVPLSHAELVKHGRQQFPIVLGSVAIAINLEGIDRLSLSGSLLADIYLGKIQSWSDPAIKQLNPELNIPDVKITPIHRKDGSGTTFMFTSYLSSTSDEWKAKYGADTLVAWPWGTSVESTQDLILAVKATKGAIAYAEYGQVERADLSIAAIKNKSGKFVMPGPEGVRAAQAAVDWTKAEDFALTLTDQPGEATYPICGATYAVVPVAGRSPGRYRRVHDYFRLAFETGSMDAEALRYVPVTEPLVSQIKQYWLRTP